MSPRQCHRAPECCPQQPNGKAEVVQKALLRYGMLVSKPTTFWLSQVLLRLEA